VLGAGTAKRSVTELSWLQENPPPRTAGFSRSAGGARRTLEIWGQGKTRRSPPRVARGMLLDRRGRRAGLRRRRVADDGGYRHGSCDCARGRRDDRDGGGHASGSGRNRQGVAMRNREAPLAISRIYQRCLCSHAHNAFRSTLRAAPLRFTLTVRNVPPDASQSGWRSPILKRPRAETRWGGLFPRAPPTFASTRSSPSSRNWKR